MTPAQAVAACRKLRDELSPQHKIEMGACRSVARMIRRRAVAGFTSTGIGRSVFGSKAQRGKTKGRDKSLKVVIPGPRVIEQGTGFLITSKLRGIAALVERGGSTKPHRITGEQGASARRWGGLRKSTRAISGRLSFMGPNGHVISPKAVNHPGSRFAKDDFYNRAWAEAPAMLKAEIEKRYQKLAEAVK